MTDNVDSSRLDQWTRDVIQRQSERELPRWGGGDGEGPHMPDMELLKARVETLEKTVDRMDGKLNTLDTRMRTVEGDLREVKATLIGITDQLKNLNNKLPSWWQMPVVMAGMLALIGVAVKAGILHP